MITHHKVSTFLIILQKLHASFYSHQRSHTNHPPYSSKIPAISPNRITVNRLTANRPPSQLSNASSA